MLTRDESRCKWERRLISLLNLFLFEGNEILLRTKNEESKLLEVQKELNTIPNSWKTSATYLLRWIFRNIFFRRKIFRKIVDEIGEIERVRMIVSCHLAYCMALHGNIPRMSRDEIYEALNAMLEKWYVFDFHERHRIKYVSFSSEVRLYNIRQLLE